MTKPIKVSLGVLALLLLIAVATWGWYFATRPAPLSKEKILTAQPRRVVPGQKSKPMQWRPANAKERAAAIKSIVGQLEAFKADRYEVATRFQSRALKNNFSSVENFRRVIKQVYPQFARYKNAKFGTSRASSDSQRVQIEIQLTGQDNVKVRAMYDMVLEDGIYRVAGVNGGETLRDTPPPQSTPEPVLPPGVRKIAAMPREDRVL
jgi:outer membrane receptor for Fe3+-dicitrate